MNNIIKIASILLILIVTSEVISQTPIRRPRTTPQRDRVDEPQKKATDFKSKLWYGGNINLGFQGNNFESIFNIGLAPMVGYKITPAFSIGPRVEINYSYYKVAAGPSILRYNLYSGGIGPFARYKFFKMLFFHVEYQLEYAQFPSINPFDGSKESQFFNNTFVGLGYNAGGGEILLLYNLSDQQSRNTLGMPISLRFGFTLNF